MTPVDLKTFEGKLVVTVKEYCKATGDSPVTAYRKIRRGELESYRDGAARRITVRSILARVERLIAEQKSEAA